MVYARKREANNASAMVKRCVKRELMRWQEKRFLWQSPRERPSSAQQQQHGTVRTGLALVATEPRSGLMETSCLYPCHQFCKRAIVLIPFAFL